MAAFGPVTWASIWSRRVSFCEEAWQPSAPGSRFRWRRRLGCSPPWARPTPASAWALEFLLEDHDESRWLYRRNQRISLPLERLGRVDARGIPFIRPEVALLFKAPGHAIERNAADFEAALPALDAEARAWLRAALETAHPGHPWIGRL